MSEKGQQSKKRTNLVSVPKIGPNGSFERFFDVFLTYVQVRKGVERYNFRSFNKFCSLSRAQKYVPLTLSQQIPENHSLVDGRKVMRVRWNKSTNNRRQPHI
jgi:hypothetical protein